MGLRRNSRGCSLRARGAFEKLVREGQGGVVDAERTKAVVKALGSKKATELTAALRRVKGRSSGHEARRSQGTVRPKGAARARACLRSCAPPRRASPARACACDVEHQTQAAGPPGSVGRRRRHRRSAPTSYARQHSAPASPSVIGCGGARLGVAIDAVELEMNLRRTTCAGQPARCRRRDPAAWQSVRFDVTIASNAPRAIRRAAAHRRGRTALCWPTSRRACGASTTTIVRAHAGATERTVP